VHQHDALLKRGMQDRLVFPDLDLDTDRLEANDMLVSHDFLTHVRPIRK
jgi:transcription termination factor Rho